jgi:lauroyl/myristoyl acyltransferase
LSWIFNPVVDRLLRLRRPYRAEWIRDVRRGLALFPDLAGRDLEAIVRGAVLHDAFIRLVFRVQTQVPAVALAAARRLPIADPIDALRTVPQGRPIVLALMHFGPVHLAFTALARRLRGRTIYALHAGGDLAEPTARYLRRAGAIPLVSDEKSLRIVARAMAEDPHCVVVAAFDYLGIRGRGEVPFLGAEISPGRGLAYLADLHDAVVIPAWGEFGPRGARAVVAPPLEVDRDAGRPERREALIDSLFRMLEVRVRLAPERWTEWHNCRPPARASGKEAA